MAHHCRSSRRRLPEDPQDEEDADHDDDDDDDARSDTSSIGACSSSASHSLEDDADGDADEVQSKPNHRHLHNKSSLSSLDSLDDALPYKRGLSNFYSGKSKSFTALSAAAAVSSAKDIVKPENPLNKRRRLFIARSRNRRASCSSLVSIAEAADPPFLPLLPPLLSDQDDDDDDPEESLEQASPSDDQQLITMRRSRTEKRRPSLFTVSVTPFENRPDHDSFLTPKLVRSGSGSSNVSLKSPARSLSLSDLSRHAHLAHH